VDGIRYPDTTKGKDETRRKPTERARRGERSDGRRGSEKKTTPKTKRVRGARREGRAEDVSFFFTHSGRSRDETRAGGERRNRSVARVPKPRAEGERD